MTIYRLQRAAHAARPRLLWLPARIFLALIRKLLTIVTHISLNPQAKIGPGMIIPHVGPIRVGAQVIIGADCSIHHVCTIGAGSRPGVPTVGDHVMFGCHTCALGAVHIGAGAIIGAGAVIVSDIPAWSIATGVPARVSAVQRADATLQATTADSGPELTAALDEELVFWRQTAPLLAADFWNRAPAQERALLRRRSDILILLLRALAPLNYAPARDVALELESFFSSLPGAANFKEIINATSAFLDRAAASSHHKSKALMSPRAMRFHLPNYAAR